MTPTPQPIQQPQAPQGPMQPQAQAGPSQPMQPPTKHTQPKASGREGQPYNPQLMAKLEDHLNKLPPQQKAYLSKYLTPELVIIFGIVLGNEAFDYFKKFANPKNMLVVQPRPQQAPGQPQQGPAPQQNTPPQPQAQAGAAPAPQQQNPSSSPARSIMGR